MTNTSAPTNLAEPFRQHWLQIETTIRAYIRSGYIRNSDIVGKRVLDLECGLGAGAQIFSLLGAEAAFGYDTFLGADVPTQYVNEAVVYVSADFSQMSRVKSDMDFIYLNNSTEHIANMSLLFCKAFSALKPGGCLFLTHDNYYQPVGHHDHKFLFLNESGTAVEPVAPRCYEHPSKCDFSLEYRQSLMNTAPLTWSQQLELLRDPSDCTTCPYFKRSQPWAHLKYQREFGTLFAFPLFKTVDGGYLNKITIFQLRQFALEAGFKIELEERYWLMNTIDVEPMKDYPQHDLVTFQYLLRLRKEA